MKYAIVTDHTVAKLYGSAALRYFGAHAQLFSFPPGESSKTRATKEWLEDALLECGFHKDTTIVGIGGGVVTDIAGFLASTFYRGVPLILIPTTLMAMVDTAIGGKNGVNTERGKNQIGTIYQPSQVIFDPRFLATLPASEWMNGFSEIVKHGLIAEPSLLKTFDICEAIEVKRRIIASDIYDKGKRRLLNFGHKVAHALETASGYQMTHGIAVAKGMVIESRIALELGFLNPSAFDTIERFLPPASFELDPEAVFQAMAKPIKLSMLKDIGEPYSFDGEYCTPVDPELVRRILYDYALHTASIR
ncbi:MAG: 3-dehydroquinate synthase [Verrucomicrobia bacterium]|nr:3-dehydroquinate synthase [Verrucomicrobiota bacterium]